MVDIDPRAFLTKRLDRLVSRAEEKGISRDMTVALVTDIINGPPFNVAPANAQAVDEDWNKDIGETDAMVNKDTTGGLIPLDDTAVGPGFVTPALGGIGGRGRF